MDYKKTYKKIEKRYILVAIILLLLFTSRQIAIQFLINHDKGMSTIINISGRQRMLSQKITKEILLISEGGSKQRLDPYIEDLEVSLNLFENSHYDLVYGNKYEGLRYKNSPRTKTLFQEIDPYFKAIVLSGDNILDMVKQKSYSEDSMLEEVEKIKKNEASFLEKMDDIVFQYDDEATEVIVFIERVEIILFVLMLFSISFLTIFVALPGTRTLRHAFIDINESNDNIKKLFYSLRGSLFLVNKDGDIITMNSDAQKLLDLEEYKSKSLNIRSAIVWRGFNIMKAIDKALLRERLDGLEVKIGGPDNKNLTIMLSAGWGSYNGEDIILISAYDISAQKEAEDILKNIAVKDELTGLYNRRFLESIVEDELERARRYEYPITAAMLDIDKFKNVNDTWGHPVGDIILKDIAHTLMKNSRASDYVIRVGGEEFVILMPHTNLEGGYKLAEKIRLIIENKVHPIVGKYTVSFGLAESTKDESYSELYARMDVALYEAKESGRNRVVKSISGESKSLKWRDSWNSGEKTIDSQHKELFTMLNNILDSSDKSEDKALKIDTFDDIIEKTEKHFICEEKILADVEYIDLLEHKLIHEKLVEKLYGLKEEFINERISYQASIEIILHDLILGHFLKEV